MHIRSRAMHPIRTKRFIKLDKINLSINVSKHNPKHLLPSEKLFDKRTAKQLFILHKTSFLQ